jgi:hypothetical protein
MKPRSTPGSHGQARILYGIQPEDGLRDDDGCRNKQQLMEGF